MRIHWFMLVIALLTFCSIDARGAEYRIVPSFSAKEEYNNNILFSQDNRRHDLITTLSPGLDLTRRDDRLDTGLSARVDRLLYSDNTSLNATSEIYNGTASYRVSPLFTVSTQAGYAKYANPTLASTTEGNASVTAPWHHIAGAASAQYQFTEKALMSFSYYYGKDYYDDPNYQGNIVHDVSTGFGYDLGRYLPRLKGMMNIGYSYYAYPDSKVNSAIVTIGLSRDIRETWSINMNAGMRRTWSEFTTQQLVPSAIVDINGQTIPIGYHMAGVTDNTASWGDVVNVSVNYRGERTTGSLAYTRDLSPASGLNGAAEHNGTSFSVQRRITEELTASLSLSYNLLRSDPSQYSAQASDQNSSNVAASLRYAFDRNTNMEASYDNSLVEYPGSGTTARRQSVFLRLSTQYPLFE